MRTSLLSRIVLLGLATLMTAPAAAEYGDVVLHRNSEPEGLRPVALQHWFHSIRPRCKVCHSELGFRMRAGSNVVTIDFGRKK